MRALVVTINYAFQHRKAIKANVFFIYFLFFVWIPGLHNSTKSSDSSRIQRNSTSHIRFNLGVCKLIFFLLCWFFVQIKYRFVLYFIRYYFYCFSVCLCVSVTRHCEAQIRQFCTLSLTYAFYVCVFWLSSCCAFFFFSLADCALYLSQYIAASVVWHQFTRDRDQNNQSNKQKCYLFCCCYCCYHLVSMLVYSVCHLVNERIKYHTFRWCKSVKLYPNHTKSAYFFRIYHQKNKLSTKKINKSTRIKNDALFTLINLIEIPRDFARLDFSRIFIFLFGSQSAVSELRFNFDFPLRFRLYWIWLSCISAWMLVATPFRLATSARRCTQLKLIAA